MALAVVAAACGSSSDGGDEAAEDEGEVGSLALDDVIADNGYGDITLGKSLADLRETYGSDTFVASSYGPGGIESYTVEGLDQLQLLFRDGVLTQVDVTGPGLRSINGDHQVGDDRSDIVATYRARIEAGETELSITCAADNVTARARSAYRLAFFVDDGRVVKISALRSEHIVPGVPCEDADAPPVEEYVKDPEEDRPGHDDGTNGSAEPPDPVTVADFVPDQLASTEILVRNPNTNQLSDEYAFLWWTAAHRFTAVGVVGYADSIVACLYEGEPPAVAGRGLHRPPPPRGGDRA